MIEFAGDLEELGAAPCDKRNTGACTIEGSCRGCANTPRGARDYGVRPSNEKLSLQRGYARDLTPTNAAARSPLRPRTPKSPIERAAALSP